MDASSSLSQKIGGYLEIQGSSSQKTGNYSDADLEKYMGIKGIFLLKSGAKLFEGGLRLFTTLRNKMKNKLIELQDKVLLRKKILTVNDQLKNISQFEHTRHRSIGNFFINALAAIAAYIRQPKKPHINLDGKKMGLMLSF